jgi:hypothetical protein
VTGLPAGLKVELEFTAGTWTDVTADALSFEIKVGRTSPDSAPQTSTCSVVFDNPTGKYTPGLQTLTDATAAPYYPNVVPNIRQRISNSSGVRWLGYVLEWLPTLVGGVVGQTTVNGVDVFDRLGRITMQTPIAQEAAIDGAKYFWPLNDDAGTVEPDESNGGPSLRAVGSGPAVAFGVTGPPSNDGTAVQFSPSSTTSGQTLSTSSLNLSSAAFTLELWIHTSPSTNPSWASSFQMNVAGFDDGNGNATGLLWILNDTLTFQSNLNNVADNSFWSDTSFNKDGGWGYVAVTYDGTRIRMYTGGGTGGTVLIGSYLESFAGSKITNFVLGESANTSVFAQARFGGLLAGCAIYDTALSKTILDEHAAASVAYHFDTPAGEVARLLRWAGIDSTLSANYAKHGTSSLSTGSYPQGGVDIASAIQDWATTEGGGAAVYVDAGTVVFNGRNFRNNPTPTITVDAVADADASGGVDGRISSAPIVNSVTVNWANRVGTRSTAVVTDDASITKYGLRTGSDVTSYAAYKPDAVAIGRGYLHPEPGFEFPSVTVDLFTAQNNLYSAVAATKVGSRLRVTNLPVVSGPSSIVDVIVEGWTETAAVDSYMIQYDTSPADNPARALWDDTTYGRWQATGFTLNATVTATATTIQVAFPAGRLGFDTVSGYPFNLKIGAEIVTVTAPPAGSTSPQTLTVTRGQSGTAKAAHTAGSAVSVWPVAAWTL